MKKILLVALLLVMVAFTGCLNKEKEEQSNVASFSVIINEMIVKDVDRRADGEIGTGVFVTVGEVVKFYDATYLTTLDEAGIAAILAEMSAANELEDGVAHFVIGGTDEFLTYQNFVDVELDFNAGAEVQLEVIDVVANVSKGIKF